MNNGALENAIAKVFSDTQRGNIALRGVSQQALNEFNLEKDIENTLPDSANDRIHILKRRLISSVVHKAEEIQEFENEFDIERIRSEVTEILLVLREINKLFPELRSG